MIHANSYSQNTICKCTTRFTTYVWMFDNIDCWICFCKPSCVWIAMDLCMSILRLSFKAQVYKIFLKFSSANQMFPIQPIILCLTQLTATTTSEHKWLNNEYEKHLQPWPFPSSATSMSQLLHAVIVTSKAWRSWKPFETSRMKTGFNVRRFASSIISLTFDSTVQEVRQLIESIFPEAS